MFNKKIDLPKEGDLLFEKKAQLFMAVFFLFLSILWIIKSITKDWYQDSLGENIFDSIFLLLSIIWVIVFSILFIEGIRFGFSDETYKGYYFSDKIVFYRISSYVSKNLIDGKSTKELEIELERLKWEQSRSRDGEDVISLKGYYNVLINNLEEKIIISKNPKKPHVTELFFSDVKYFLNKKEEIKVVQIDNNEYSNIKKFFDEIVLAKPYSKNPAEIVAFLNEKVKNLQRKTQ